MFPYKWNVTEPPQNDIIHKVAQLRNSN